MLYFLYVLGVYVDCRPLCSQMMKANLQKKRREFKLYGVFILGTEKIEYRLNTQPVAQSIVSLNKVLFRLTILRTSIVVIFFVEKL